MLVETKAQDAMKCYRCLSRLSQGEPCFINKLSSDPADRRANAVYCLICGASLADNPNDIHAGTFTSVQSH